MAKKHAMTAARRAALRKAQLASARKRKGKGKSKTRRARPGRLARGVAGGLMVGSSVLLGAHLMNSAKKSKARIDEAHFRDKQRIFRAWVTGRM